MLNKNNDRFYILKDGKGNDIIYINNKNIIYTNKKDTKFEYQFYLYTKYLNQGICNIYNINKDISIIKQDMKKQTYWYLKDKDKTDEIFNFKKNEKECAIYFNDYYVAIASLEYGAGVEDFLLAYDIGKSKYIDINDYDVESNLYKYLVEVRGCSKENIINVLDNKTFDKKIMFNFMSFIFDEQINDNNCLDYIGKLKDYILKIYPELKENKNLKNIYYFHRKDKKIDNLKYKNQKTYVLKK